MCVVRYRTERVALIQENKVGAIADTQLLQGLSMNNPPKTNDDELKDNNVQEQSPDESDESVLVSEETHGNRAEEKIENRSNKKQETHEEAKSVTGTEPHHDARNEHPDSGPAPLDRY
ncbi:hypothetical protein [Nitrosovibrio sp. Nv6]|uniref:hypothetical protein n=1 Tax=Nitrosovibrio sp. Nv6 TaxID=1855340 RepID=UPI0008BBF019|nr:hypothetical protein [Nitrosovibrio sp. Nv6]SEO54244.1 hypothetical protein SAMN05216316_0451 [Nitrosovibrio sp. Nv6]